ncbi:hypothetical protein ACFL2V_09330 [Pseudomonadota bacterium]
MPKKDTNLQLILIIAITAIITFGGTVMWQKSGVERPEIVAQETADWLTYTSENEFSFKFPPGYLIGETTSPENADTTVVFISTVMEEDRDPVPVLQINVSAYSVSFSLWEGLEWEGYPAVISTFKYL